MWLNGLTIGYGRLIYEDGRYFEGMRDLSKANGFGKMVYPDGKVEEGNWKDDHFLGDGTSHSGHHHHHHHHHHH